MFNKSSRKWSCFLVVLFLVLSLTGNVFAQEIEGKKLENKIQSYIEKINKQNYKEAAKLFHYPRSYSQEKLTEDIDGVSRLLKLVTNELGKIESFQRVNKNVNRYKVSIAGGNIPYWKKYWKENKVHKLLYEVEFKNDGTGYIVFLFGDINEEVEIAQANYGLAISKPDAKGRIVEIGEKMMELMHLNDEK